MFGPQLTDPATGETFELEFIKCYACQHVWLAPWPDDPLSPSRPPCPKCRSAEVYPVDDHVITA